MYFILNQNDSAHYAKINKAFLGDENAYVMASIPDSSIYKNIDVWLFSFNLNATNYNNEWIDSVKLEPTYEVPKDTVRLNGEPAIFPPEGNLLYKTTLLLKTDRQYKLMIYIPGSNKRIFSITRLNNDFSVIKPTSVEQISFYNSMTGYRDYTVKWQCDSNAVLYGISMRFHYREEYSDGAAADKYVDWVRPNISHADPEGKDVISSTFPGDGFYSYIGTVISEGDDPLIKRVSTGIDFIFVSAGEELSTYIKMNDPSNSMVQERPLFSNFDDEHKYTTFGVFSARFNKTIAGKNLDDMSLQELAKGDATRHLRFKDQNGQTW